MNLPKSGKQGVRIVKRFGQKRRPCTFGRSLWYTNCPVNFSFFWSTKFFFGIPNIFLVHQIGFFGVPNFFLVYQFSFWYTKFFFWLTKFFFGRPKKWEIDQTIGIPKRLTKSTWTPLICISLVIGGKMSLFFYEAAKSLRSSWPFSTSTDANCQWSGSYYSGLSTLTKCHCESVGLHEFYHHSNNWSFHKK